MLYDNGTVYRSILNKEDFPEKLSNFQTSKLSNVLVQTLKLSNFTTSFCKLSNFQTFQTSKLSNFQTSFSKLSNFQTFKLFLLYIFKLQTFKLSNFQTFELPVFYTLCRRWRVGRQRRWGYPYMGSNETGVPLCRDKNADFIVL